MFELTREFTVLYVIKVRVHIVMVLIDIQFGISLSGVHDFLILVSLT